MRVFKTLIFFIVITLSVIEVKAQTYKIGAVGGLNFANLNQLAIEYSHRTALGIGGVLEYDINKNLAVCVQPMYVQKGGKLKENDIVPSANLDAEIQLSYIEIPAFLKVPMAFDPKYYVLAGPTFGFAIGSQEKLKGDDINVTVDVKPTTKSFDLGLLFGCGANFPIGNNSFFVEMRYSFGQIDIAKGGDIQIWREKYKKDDGLVKTRGLQIMMGILVPIMNQVSF
jgi:hypothetical protein